MTNQDGKELKPMDPYWLDRIRRHLDTRFVTVDALLNDRDFHALRLEALESSVDKLLIALLGEDLYPDNRIASCNKARHRAECADDPILAAMRERARSAEHRVAGLCAANADCYRHIAELRSRLGMSSDDLISSAESLERQALRIVERERDEARAEIAKLNAEAKNL